MPRTLVTSALTYANGPIHFGHVVGANLPADVYARTLRALGEEVLYVGGTDEHGVAITIGAEQEGRPYDEYVAHWRDEIKKLFDAVGIEFDVWSGTSVSPHHVALSQEIFRDLFANGYLLERENEQLYCLRDERYLADRYVRGTCPHCGHGDARGDECPSCGKWLDPLDFAEPRCGICGDAPERRVTKHWHLDLAKLRDEHLGAWIEGHEWKANVRAFIANQVADLRDRPITRDMSWGVPVPQEIAGDATGKVLYVWFDAPIGYISFTREWADARGTPEAWLDWWRPREGEDVRLVHFIGKDNIPFHCIVFPAMLWGAGRGSERPWVLPAQVPANEFYNLQGAKFSTSKDWTIPLERFFEEYDAEAARFYLIASMPETADSEWSWREFQSCVNASLADTIGNLATRVLRFVDKHWDGRVPPVAAEHAAELDRTILEECGPVGDPAEFVREFRFRRAAEQLIENARVANVFLDRTAPWALRKTDPERAGAVLATACEWIGWTARWMVPFMPGKASRLWSMVGGEGAVTDRPWPGVPVAATWRQLAPERPLGEVAGLFDKLDDERIEAEIADLERRGAAAD